MGASGFRTASVSSLGPRGRTVLGQQVSSIFDAPLKEEKLVSEVHEMAGKAADNDEDDALEVYLFAIAQSLHLMIFDLFYENIS
ncbi:hypothetical protein V6N13_046412 [Hibiscus sabdariffa]|uniref:Uncharacterized protein n=1 Tax=Hibiscus sabdariffa TaxID=183260 RepID=A0ABR2NZC4_9ROSI